MTVNRPRVDVPYRKGYFALKPSDASAETRESELRSAVWRPLDATAVAMNARVDFIDLPGADSIDGWKGELDVVSCRRRARVRCDP